MVSEGGRRYSSISEIVPARDRRDVRFLLSSPGPRRDSDNTAMNGEYHNSARKRTGMNTHFLKFFKKYFATPLCGITGISIQSVSNLHLLYQSWDGFITPRCSGIMILRLIFDKAESQSGDLMHAAYFTKTEIV